MSGFADSYVLIDCSFGSHAPEVVAFVPLDSRHPRHLPLAVMTGVARMTAWGRECDGGGAEAAWGREDGGAVAARRRGWRVCSTIHYQILFIYSSIFHIQCPKHWLYTAKCRWRDQNQFYSR